MSPLLISLLLLLPPLPATGFIASIPKSWGKVDSSIQTALAATEQLTRFQKKKLSSKSFKPPVDLSDAPFSYDDFASAVSAVSYDYGRDTVVTGTVVQYEGSSGALVDIGAKCASFLPAEEAGLGGPQGEKKGIEGMVTVGEEREFQIISEEDSNGQLLVSLRRILYRKAWEKVTSIQSSDDIFTANVIAVNRGGAIVLVEGLRAFLPGSHLAGQLPTEDIIGTELPLKFLEVNQEANKLVVSNRKAVVETQMKDLKRGDVVEGVVKACKNYGVFVDLMSMSGLLHISQISYDRIDDLEKVLAVGDRIKCMIIDYNAAQGRIALSTKTLEPEPGDFLRDKQRVFDLASETAAKYHARQEAERTAREEAASAIVTSLADLADDSDAEADPLKDVGDQLAKVLEEGDE